MAIPAGVLERTQRHEGLSVWPYLDTANDGPRVTIGVGHMVPKLATFKALPLVGLDNQGAADDVVESAWTTLQGLVAEQKAHGYKSDYFESKTNVRLPLAEATKLLSVDLEGAITALERAFSNFGSFPVPAQAALIDLMFNIGAARFVEGKWPSLFAAVRATPPKWDVAAEESSRKPPCSTTRNEEIKNLFLEAARSP